MAMQLCLLLLSLAQPCATNVIHNLEFSINDLETDPSSRLHRRPRTPLSPKSLERSSAQEAYDQDPVWAPLPEEDEEPLPEEMYSLMNSACAEKVKTYLEELKPGLMDEIELPTCTEEELQPIDDPNASSAVAFASGSSLEKKKKKKKEPICLAVAGVVLSSIGLAMAICSMTNAAIDKFSGPSETQVKDTELYIEYIQKRLLTAKDVVTEYQGFIKEKCVGRDEQCDGGYGRFFVGALRQLRRTVQDAKKMIETIREEIRYAYDPTHPEHRTGAQKTWTNPHWNWLPVIGTAVWGISKLAVKADDNKFGRQAYGKVTELKIVWDKLDSDIKEVHARYATWILHNKLD